MTGTRETVSELWSKVVSFVSTTAGEHDAGADEDCHVQEYAYVLADEGEGDLAYLDPADPYYDDLDSLGSLDDTDNINAHGNTAGMGGPGAVEAGAVEAGAAVAGGAHNPRVHSHLLPEPSTFRRALLARGVRCRARRPCVVRMGVGGEPHVAAARHRALHVYLTPWPVCARMACTPWPGCALVCVCRRRHVLTPQPCRCRHVLIPHRARSCRVCRPVVARAVARRRYRAHA